jgi:hypothetical protein
MSRARPLRTTGTDAERRLLAAGSAERPDAASMRRTAEALGVLPRALVFGAAVALALRSVKWTPVILQGFLPLASVGAVAIIAYHIAERPEPVALTRIAPSAGAPVRVSNQTDGPATAPAPRTVEATADPPRPVALVASEAAAPALRPHAAPRATTRAVARATPPAKTTDSLREQAELLDRARVRIATGDTAGGLAVLDDYDRRFAGAPLSEESVVLRIEALARRGDRSSAAALGRQFLKTYPTSVHADRLSSLLHSLSP